MKSYRYLLVGGGISADAACRGIRGLDPAGSIGLVSQETDPPYNRPALSKGLWKGQPIDQIMRNTSTLGVDLHLGRKILSIDPAAHMVTDDHGETYAYAKLLLATGGSPIRLPAGQADQGDQVIYFRTLADFRRLSAACLRARHIMVIGGGFIGSEIAAVLAEQGQQVSMLFLEKGICARIFPAGISDYLNGLFREKGLQILPEQRVERIETVAGQQVVVTSQGQEIPADWIVAGLGIRPNLELAVQAGLEIGDGIRVDNRMRTSNPDIFACGDVVSFPSSFFGRFLRVEHEENANLSGQTAGENMAGADSSYDPIPYLYSAMFDLNYEALGDLDPQAEVYPDWIQPYQQGTLYYLKDNRVRGILLWNMPGRRAAAQHILQDSTPSDPASLTGRILPVTSSPPRRILRRERNDSPPPG